MIKVWKKNMMGKKNFYQVKIMYDGKKVVDVTCKCDYGKINKDFWKNPSKRPCRHANAALYIMDMEIRNGKTESGCM